MKHTLTWVDGGGAVTFEYRPVHEETLTDEVERVPPKARVY
jgi:succinate dehydrogenase / fumarate reductase flavoprotein subunit